MFRKEFGGVYCLTQHWSVYNNNSTTCSFMLLATIILLTAMAYDLHYDRLLKAIQSGEEKEAISLFASKLFDVNEQIEYIFEDRKRYIVTPLYWAVRHRRPNVCKYLLRNGARAYEHMVYEYYPLHEACNMGYEDIVHEFVEARCNLDKVTSDCDTPLHVACMRGHISCVHILLRAGANCNLQNKAGHTPLEAALYHNHRDLVSLFEVHEKGGWLFEQ